MSNRLFRTLYPMCYRVLMAALLAGAVINCAGHLFGVPEGLGWSWIPVIALLLLLAGLNFGKPNVKVLCAIALVLGITVLIPLIGAGQPGGFWEEYGNWFMGKADYEEEWLASYELMQVVWAVLGCYLFQIILEKKQLFQNVLAVLFFAGLLICMFLKVNINRAGVVCSILMIMITYVQQMRLNWETKKLHGNKEYTLFLVPFLAVYLVILIWSPVNAEPYDWKFAKDVYENLSEKATIWWENRDRENREDFGLASMGFSEDRKLTGGLMKSDKPIMTVKGNTRQFTNGYLRGKSYDTFDGIEWTKEAKGELMEYPLDAWEILYAIKRFDPEGADKYVHIANLHVRYEYFNTGHLFAPGKVLGIQNTDFYWNGADAVFTEKKGYSTEYDVSYYQLNLSNPAFRALLEADLQEDEAVWGEMLASGPSLLRHNYTLENLKEYREDIAQNYCQDVILSEEVKAYLADALGEYESDYQKLKAIETLLDSYHYTNMPGKIPGRVKTQEDFLDYFLLESRKGFCSHFATAFVLLARAEGFPARYVEGFCIPLTGSKYMEVNAGMSHAWPEVYLEGIGWIPFEPTPGYESLRYSGWEVKDLYRDEDYSKRSTPPPLSDDTEEELAKEAQEAKNKQRVSAVLRGFCLILLICLVVSILQNRLQKYRYKRMSTEKKFLAEVKRSLWIFAGLGYKRKENETLSELQKRVIADSPYLLGKKEDGNKAKKEFAFLRAYEEYLYRKEQISEESLKEIQAEGKELLDLIKEEQKRTYLWLRIALWFRIGM